ncbi:MAG TPA: hypothetical protein VJN92_18240 [Candidatus Acidoferrum sp.]|nr:hypothetical protein [Candidatus Acidoferrum sp.]
MPISFASKVLHYLSKDKRKSNRCAIVMKVLQNVEFVGTFRVRRDASLASPVADIACTELEEANISRHITTVCDRGM